MKRIVTLLLALLLLLSLAACGAAQETAAPAAEETPAAAGDEPQETAPAAEGAEGPADAGEPEPAPIVEQPDLSDAPTAIDENEQALLEQFLLIDEIVQPGSAGSSLRAVVAASSLLDWADGATLDDEAVEVVMDYLASMTPEGLEEYHAKLDAVESTVQLLTGSDKEQAEGLLADAGMRDNCKYPWSEKATQNIEYLMSTIGRR